MLWGLFPFTDSLLPSSNHFYAGFNVSPGELKSKSSEHELPEPPLCVREEHHNIGDVGDKSVGVKRLPPAAPPPLPATLSTYRPASASGNNI